MSQFWTDFSGDTVGSAPTGWTLEGFLAGECVVVETAGARGGKELAILPTTNARRTAIWNLPSTVTDAEVLIRMRATATTGSRYPAFIRKNSSGASLQGYTLKLAYTDAMRGGRYNTGYLDLGTADVSKSGLYNFDQPTKYFYVRVRVQGTAYKAKAWNADVAEPASWDIELTDSTLTSAGGVGIFAYYSTGGMYVDSFGVGTDGDSAPDTGIVAAVADFTATPTTGVAPVSVQFTDISSGATSWLWQFGDGQTSTAQNPQHTYSAIGSYSVTLTINGGASEKIRSGYIAVSDGNSPTLSGNFEGGNVDEVLSSVVANGADWTINIVPRKQQNDYIATPAWWYFGVKLDKMTGKRPTFNLTWTDWVGKTMSLTAPKASWVPCYTYTPEDPTSWVYAPSHTWSSPTASWQFTSAFSSDVVYVAYRPFCTPTVIKNWVNSLSGISNLQGKSNYTVGTLPSTVDETGRVIPAQDILGFTFGTGPAQMVVASGVHPCEDHGTLAMQSFVETLLASPTIKSEFTVMVYPCINPQGRWGRSYRGAFDSKNLTKDPARDWVDSPALSCTQIVRADIVSRCSGGRPDALFDFHGHYQQGDSHGVYGWNGVVANYTIEQAYQTAVGNALNIGALFEPASAGSVQMLPPYFSTKSAGGPPGVFFVIEISDWLPDQVTASRSYGTLLANQLSSIVGSIFGRWPVATVGTLSATSSSQGIQLSASSVGNATKYNFYRNGSGLALSSLSTSYYDSSALAGTQYSYTYTAANPGSTSASSPAVLASISEAPTNTHTSFGVVQFYTPAFNALNWGIK